MSGKNIPVVPFVTLWSDEQEKHQAKKIGWTPFGIVGPVPDKRGIRWAQYGASMSGQPIFASVHPIRQKICMEGPHCQVCGQDLSIERKTPWLLNGSTDPRADQLNGSFLTTTPPTCPNCMDVAKELCPHLSSAKSTPRLLVSKFRIVGVYGDLYENADPEQAMLGVRLNFGTPGAKEILPFLSAKQLVVEIRNFRVIA